MDRCRPDARRASGRAQISRCEEVTRGPIDDPSIATVEPNVATSRRVSRVLTSGADADSKRG
jgi:hypothetical protein